ncbi:MAG TPA: dodecin family protein [Acidimicrobiia bacterium]|nr:dodecin family protein [Acidimicrobiia bacterium]
MGYIESGAIKVVEIIGVSAKSWEDAAKMAVAKAAESLEGITGVEAVSFTARVKDGKIVSHTTTCKIAFAVK